MRLHGAAAVGSGCMGKPNRITTCNVYALITQEEARTHALPLTPFIHIPHVQQQQDMLAFQSRTKIQAQARRDPTHTHRPARTLVLARSTISVSFGCQCGAVRCGAVRPRGGDSPRWQI